MKLGDTFPPAAVQHTDGKITRKGYDTSGIGYQWIVDRMNDVLGLEGWRPVIVENRVTVGQTANGRPLFDAVCRLRIELLNNRVVTAERECYGGHASTNEADALKGAYTNALKKTAALFGCGAEAFRGQLDPDNQPIPESPKKQQHDPGVMAAIRAAVAVIGKDKASKIAGKKIADMTQAELQKAAEALTLAALCVRHDWHYEKSDDPRARTRGQEERRRINAAFDAIEDKARRETIHALCVA